MKLKNYLNIVIGVCIVVFIVVSEIRINKYKKSIVNLTEELNEYKKIDVPSKGEIDSIKLNIQYKDSIISHITTEYIKDVEWVKNMPDSAAVALFNQLVWADSNYR
jgi:hypothetical protein